jgi:hypothetical protein
VEAEVLDREEDDVKGLALLRLKVRSGMAKGVTALELGATTQLGGGEDVRVIGFPDGTAFWTVGSGVIARLEGRNLVFSGSVRSGNSGGPVIFNGQVIGLMTDVSGSSAYAARGEVIELYVNGIEPTRAATNRSIPHGPQSSRTPSTNDEQYNGVNQAVFLIVKTGQDDFYPLVGPPTVASKSAFESKTKIPGATYTWVYPKERVVSQLDYSDDRRKIEAAYYDVISKLRSGFSDWEFKEEPEGTSSGDAKYRKFKLRRQQKGSVIEVSYNLTTSEGNGYALFLTIWSPNNSWVW